MNTLAFPIDNGLISGEGLTRLLAKYVANSGVVEPNALKVAPLPSPDMKVRIPGSTNDDHLVVKKPGGGYLVGWNLENYDLAIAPNTTGVTKMDAVVAYFDPSAASLTIPEAPNGLTFRTVRRPLAETGDPTDGLIDSIIGHSNWYRLSNVLVTHNATSISGGIIDTRALAGIDGSKLKDGSVTAAKLANVPWTTYTPAWSTSGAAPSIGNGSLVGRYQRIGRTIIGEIVLIAGSTTSFGSGDLLFSSPVLAAENSRHQAVGGVYAEDFGVGGYQGMLRLNASSANVYSDKLLPVFVNTTGTGKVSSTTATIPFTFGTNDYIIMSFSYESAN